MLNTPPEIAAHYSEGAANRIKMPAGKIILLGIMAGLFISMAAVGSNVLTSSTTVSPVFTKLLSSMIFPVGIIMVVIAGSELFTGNCLMIVSVLDKKISAMQMIKFCTLVYIGNFLGALFVSVLAVASGQMDSVSGAVAVNTIKIAASKCALDLPTALLLGVMCNIVVCTAIWIHYAGKDAPSKILGMYFPVLLFVLCGFEHCVANMYYIPAGLLALGRDTYLQAAVAAGVDISALTWGNFFLTNLIPVTIGNIVGGSGVVGLMYWLIYRKTWKS